MATIHHHFLSCREEGAKVIIDSPAFGKIEASVTLPHFKAPYFSGGYLAEEIAHVLALQKLRRLMKKKV